MCHDLSPHGLEDILFITSLRVHTAHQQICQNISHHGFEDILFIARLHGHLHQQMKYNIHRQHPRPVILSESFRKD